MIAATIAAQALSRGLPDEEFATSDQMVDALAGLVDAKRVADDSQQAMITLARMDLGQETRPR